MLILDYKTPNRMQADDRFVYSQIETEDDISVKASYVIAGRVSCGKISALFDFTVLGDIDAEEIDVKGQFVCLGECKVRGRVIVQNDIVSNSIKAKEIHCSGKVTAQKLDVGTIACEETILVGKTLFVQESAQTFGNILCGETIYGAGKVRANMIVTAEKQDLDGGEAAMEAPRRYSPKTPERSSESAEAARKNLVQRNNFIEYIGVLLQSTENPYFHEKLYAWRKTLICIRQAFDKGVGHFTDIKQLVILTEIVRSVYFEDWDCLANWHAELSKHFQAMVCGKIIERPTKPLNSKALSIGDILVHKIWGEGAIIAMDSDYVTVNFETVEKKAKFNSATLSKYFTAAYICGGPIRLHVEFFVKDYNEWVSLFYVLETYRDCFFKEVYDYLFKTLTSQIEKRQNL